MSRLRSWEAVIGLEIHAQIKSDSKLFSSAKVGGSAAPNSQVALFDAAIPGTLPVLNQYCVDQAIKSGLALGAKINRYSAFDRKHYFYPDLPNGYQISQFFHPIVGEGLFKIEMPGGEKHIKIERIHMEQDAGKSLHDLDDEFTYIDLNRAGTALMEIVTGPNFSNDKEVVAFIEQLRLILIYVGSSDGDMERGNLRCDANVSVMKKDSTTLGTRCEIKNLNSTSNIADAINHEIERQIEILENGGRITQETRLFDAGTCTTRSLRSKEDSADYRYFPDPDLLPLQLEDEYIEKLFAGLPEMPNEKRSRLKKFDISSETIEGLVRDFDKGKYFDAVLNMGVQNPKILANWVNVELANYFADFRNPSLEPAIFHSLMVALESSQINQKIAKDILPAMVESGKTADVIIKEKGLVQVSDEVTLKAVLEKILDANADKIVAYHAGKDKLFGFFVGESMKQTKGQANPLVLNRILTEMLAARK